MIKKRTETERRKRQAARYARILAVANLLDLDQGVSVEDAERIANGLGVCSRTVYRDVAVIRIAKELLANADIPRVIEGYRASDPMDV